MARWKNRYIRHGNIWYNERSGRWYVQDRNNTNVPWARVVMSYKIGRDLCGNEHVHHIDGDCSNDSMENLELLSNKEHMRLHNPLGVKEYTRDELLDNLREMHKLGIRITKTCVDAYSGPTTTTYCNVFGSLPKARELAGVGTSKHMPVYSDDDLLDHLRKLFNSGIKITEKSVNSSSGPNAATYRYHFGSFRVAKDMALVR